MCKTDKSVRYNETTQIKLNYHLFITWLDICKACNQESESREEVKGTFILMFVFTRNVPLHFRLDWRDHGSDQGRAGQD